MQAPMRLRNRLLAFSAAIAIALGGALSAPADAQTRSRIKDIADFEGIRQNKLIGYGCQSAFNRDP